VVCFQVLDLELNAGAAYAHLVPQSMETCLVYCYRGRGEVNGRPLGAQEIARLDGSDNSRRSVDLAASAEGMAVLLFAGKRIGEPIAWHGPFVMTTREELRRAFEAYQSGRFPPKRVPWNYRAGETGP